MRTEETTFDLVEALNVMLNGDDVEAEPISEEDWEALNLDVYHEYDDDPEKWVAKLSDEDFEKVVALLRNSGYMS